MAKSAIQKTHEGLLEYYKEENTVFENNIPSEVLRIFMASNKDLTNSEKELKDDIILLFRNQDVLKRVNELIETESKLIQKENSQSSFSELDK